LKAVFEILDFRTPVPNGRDFVPKLKCPRLVVLFSEPHARVIAGTYSGVSKPSNDVD
jgi:hypothetical protein